MFETILNWFLAQGMAEDAAYWSATAVGGLLIGLASLLVYYIARNYLLRLITVSVERTETQWDDIFYQQAVFSKLALIMPALAIMLLAPSLLGSSDQTLELINKVVFVYIVIVGLLAVNSFLNALLDLYRTFTWSRDFPIRGFVQMFKLLAIIFAILLVASIALDQTVLYILGTLGAATAVLMLVFQGPLLSLVAGIQLTANRMISRGDFITMPSFDAEGTVKDIALTTITVQNTDNSITMIPTQSLINQSFKNWRGIAETGSRRIKRAIRIDLNSIQPYNKVATPQLRHLMSRLEVGGRNGRFETNVSAFRTYALAYLKKHPDIYQEGFTLLVRELEPTDTGLPVEVTAYSPELDWPTFEAMQGEVFQHLTSMLPHFGLSLYQRGG